METKNLTLEILSQESEKILKTLPIAHYLKVDTIPVIFDNSSQTSYFDPNGFEIHIALNNIATAICGSNKAELTESDLEKHIRCFLYHEISHAILTPQDLMITASYTSNFVHLNPQFANVLEDERIETILKHYYYGVDFKENLKNAVPLKHAKTFENFVFNAVRFRYCPIMKKQVNDKVNNFINATREINATSQGMPLCCEMDNLLEYLKGIWEKLCEMAKSKQQQKQNQNSDSSSSEEVSSSTTENQNESSSENESSQSETNDTNKNTENNSSIEESKNAESTSSNEDDETEDLNEEKSSKEDNAKNSDNKQDSQSENQETEDVEEDITTLIKDDFEEQNDDSELSAEDIDKLMQENVYCLKKTSANRGRYSMKLKDFACDQNTKVELLKVIVRNTGTGVNQSQAQYGYCGRFSAKRFMKDHNDSYKWFEKKAYEDNQTSKKSSKKILNIWLDQSGSFEKNDEEVNKVLKALYEIELKRNDFEWRLVRVDEHFIIENNKDKRFSESHGNNALPKEEIEDCYKKLNKVGNEFNLVIFDGKVGYDFETALHDLEEETQSIINDASMSRRKKNNCLLRIAAHKGYLNSQRLMYNYQNLKVFDNKRSIFITEESNTKGIKKVCKNAKAIIEENTDYASALAKNVIKALDLLF